jgi:hypothetical protein
VNIREEEEAGNGNERRETGLRLKEASRMACTFWKKVWDVGRKNIGMATRVDT